MVLSLSKTVATRGVRLFSHQTWVSGKPFLLVFRMQNDSSQFRIWILKLKLTIFESGSSF